MGKLVNTNGTNVTDGSYSIVFSIYSVATGGSAIWTETQTPTLTNGIFQVNLGSVTSLPGSVDFNTDNLYLGIKVGADAEMTPRVQFTSVPQAFNAEKLGGLDKTGFIQNGTGTQASSNFHISGDGKADTSLTTPLLQSAAGSALTITGNAASTWSTTAGNITIQAGGGTISLGTTTSVTSTGALGITSGTTLTLASSGAGNDIIINGADILDVQDASTFASTVTLNGVTTANTDVDMTFAGTENLAITSDLAGTVDVISVTGTPSASAGTTSGLVIQQANSANTNGLDAALLINNADTDLAVATGIQFTSSGGGFTTFLDTPTIDITGAGAITGGTAITSSGTITFSGLATAGIVTNTAAGVLGTTNAVAANLGGTGFNTYAVGDLLFANTSSTLAKLADVAVGSCLTSGGVGVAPAWGSCGSGVSDLQGAYGGGNTITTTDNRNIAFTLADTATDSDFFIDLLGTGNTFAIQDGGTSFLTASDGRNISYAAGNAGQFSMTSDLTGGNRSSAVLSISQANDASSNNSSSLISLTNSDTASTSALLSISTVTSGTAISLSSASGLIGVTTGQSTGTFLRFDGATLGTGLAFGAGGVLQSGIAVNVTFGTGTTTASALNVAGNASGALSAYTGSIINVAPTRTITSGTTTDSGSFLKLTRDNTQSGGTYNLTGDLAILQSNCTSCTTDTANILEINQQNTTATGAVFNVIGAGTGNLSVFDASNTSANGVSIDIQSSSSSQYALDVRSNNGTSRLYVRADGNVGIGDTTPDAQFDIDAVFTPATTGVTINTGSGLNVSNTVVKTAGTDTTIGNDVVVVRTGATGGTINTIGTQINVTGDAAGAGTSTTTGLSVTVAGGDSVYSALFNGGSVGIGTATPIRPLHVYGTGVSDIGRFESSNGVATLGLFNDNAGANATNGTLGGSFEFGVRYNSQNILEFAEITGQYTGTGLTRAGDILFSTSNNGSVNERLRVTSAGDLLFVDAAHSLTTATETTANGIGNSLTIAAGAANGSTTGAAGGALALQGGAAAGSGNNNGGNITLDGGTATGTGTKGSIVLQGAGGNVGVGDTTPDAQLDIDSTLTTGNVFGIASSTITLGDFINIQNTSAVSSGSDMYFGRHLATYTSTVTNSGSLIELNRDLTTNTGGALTQTGDLARFLSNCTVTAGTCADSSSVVDVLQSYTGATGEVMNITNAGAGMSLRVNDDGTTTDTTPFVIDNVGNVGIGDTAPAYTLTVGNGDLFGVQGADGSLIWEGTTADVNETILTVVNPTADIIYQFADAAAGTYNICTSANNCSAIASTLQASYNADTDTGDTIIALTTADDSLIFRNPAASGTDSGYVLGVDQLNTGNVDGLQINNAGTGDLLELQDSGTAVLRVQDGGHITGVGASTATTGTTEATARTNVTTVTLTAAGSFANNDVIFINNAGQDYYTRIVSGGGTTTLTVSPTVSYDVSASVTKYNVQNIGATASDYTTLNNRLFQGYFLGGVVTGAGSTTYSDGNIVRSTNSGDLRVTNSYSATSASEQWGIRSQTTYGIADTSAKVGLRVEATATHTTGDIGTLIGVTSIAEKGAAGTITSAYGGFFRVDNDNASGAIQYAYGIYIADSVKTGAITTDYGLYQAGTSAINYFAGDLLNGGLNAMGDSGSLVQNSGFEINVDVTSTVADNWAFTQTTGAPTSAVTASAIQGDRSMTVTATTTQVGTLTSACFPVSSSNDYDFGFRYKGSVAATSTMSSRVVTYTSRANCTSKTSGTNVSTSTGKSVATTVSGEKNGFTPSATATWARAEIIVDTPSVNATVTIDSAFIGTSSTSAGVDLAENFPALASDNLVPGEVVSIGNPAPEGGSYVVRSNSANNSKIFGVVSTQPGLKLDDGLGYEKVTVALAGRVPVKVSDENGPIEVGDPITASSTSGVGMKATTAGKIIGTAVTAYNGNGEGTITVLISPQFWAPPINDTLQANSATIANLNVSGMATVGELIVTGDATIEGTLTVANAIITGNILVNGHYLSEGEKPTITKDANLGVNTQVLAASVSIDGTDSAGTITLIAGGNPLAGALTKVLFSKAYEKPPRIVVTATNEDGLNLPVYVRKVEGGFEIVTNTPPQAGKTYQFDYIIIGSNTAQVN